MIKYIADKDHYTEVLSHCEKVKHDLWIGTADLKDLYVPVPSPREGGREADGVGFARKWNPSLPFSTAF